MELSRRQTPRKVSLRLAPGANDLYPYYFKDATSLRPTGNRDVKPGDIEVVAIGHIVDAGTGLRHDGTYSPTQGNQVLCIARHLLVEEL